MTKQQARIKLRAMRDRAYANKTKAAIAHEYDSFQSHAFVYNVLWREVLMWW